MLDIKGIKQKIDEITQLTESSHSSTAISLFNIIKKGEGMQEIYYKNDGDDFENDLLDRCDEYVEDEEHYGLDKPYQDIDWIKVDDKYFNWEEIWADWKDFCENLDKPKKPENNGSEFNECLNENVDIEETGLKPLDDFVKMYKKLKADAFMNRSDCAEFMDYFNKCLKSLKMTEQESDHLFSIISDAGIDYGRNFTIMSDIDEDFPNMYEYLSDWLDDATQRGLMYYMNEDGRERYADYTYNLIKNYIDENPTVLGKYGKYDEPDKIDSIKKDGSEFNESLNETKINDIAEINYYKNRCKNIFQTHNYDDRTSSEFFISDIDRFIEEMNIESYEKARLHNEVRDICEEYAKRYTDLDYVNREMGENYADRYEYIIDVVADVMMYYMDDKRKDCAIDIYNMMISFINKMNTNLDEPSNIQNPETKGDEYLEEQKLMEMSARNYTSFDIEPYIICDTEYVGEGEPSDDEYDYYTPLEEFIDRRNGHSNPDWVIEQEGRDILPFTELNKGFNKNLVCIIGYPGYYEGMTVGIISRNVDYDLITEYFEDLHEVNENSEELYCNHESDKIFTERDAEEYIQENIIKPEIIKARDKIIDIQTEYGGKLYPSYYDIKVAGTGEEYNETKSFNKKPLNESVFKFCNEWKLDDVTHDVMNLDESRHYRYKGYDIYIECEIIDNDEQWYNAYIFKGEKQIKTISESLDGISMESWETLCDRITEWIDKNYNEDNPIKIKKPEDDGEMWTESKQPLTETTINDLVTMTLGPGDEINDIHQAGYHVVITAWDEDDEDDNDYEVYYDVSIYEEYSRPIRDNVSLSKEVLITRESFTSWSFMIDWIRRYFTNVLHKPYSGTDYDDEPVKVKRPKKTGAEFDESVQLNEDFKPWMDEPVPFREERTVEYNGYDINIEGCMERDDDGFEYYSWYNLQFYKSDIENDDEARVFETTADTWEDVCDKIMDFVDNHPIDPNLDEPKNVKKPEEDGDWIDESLDIKGIKKKINEIVRKADGNN